MNADPDLQQRIAELEDRIYELSAKGIDESLYEYVANAIYRRDVLGLDDGDVLSIIHEKLEKSY